MKVAIAGAGKVGRFLAEDLAENGHEVQLLDSNEDLVAALPPIEGVRYITADACEVSSLKAAHFDEMDVVVATTGDDESSASASYAVMMVFQSVLSHVGAVVCDAAISACSTYGPRPPSPRARPSAINPSRMVSASASSSARRARVPL